MTISKQQLDTFFNFLYGFFLLVLVISIPLVFTSYTRSVFEVNKLLLLRSVTVVTLFAWFMQSMIYKANDIQLDDTKYLSIFGLKWRKIGLEWPIIAWVITSILSTVFSQNPKLSVIGAYDRWEGLPTTLGYIALFLMFIKLIRTRQVLFIFMGGLLLSTAGSSIYGIFQSLGMDFMFWSANAQIRVFACINNPVHFCAYMAMVVPLGIGWLLYLSEKQDKSIWLRIFVATCTGLAYYGQYLSYSRAAWLGFTAAMTLFFLYISNCFYKKDSKVYTLNFMIIILVLGVYYLSSFFNLHTQGPLYLFGIFIPLAIFYIGDLIVHRQDLRAHPAQLIFGSILLFCGYLIDYHWATQLVSASLFLGLCARFNTSMRAYFERFVIIFLFIKMQFVMISISAFVLYALLITIYILLSLKHNTNLTRESKAWLVGTLVFFAFTISVPTMLSAVDASESAGNKVESYKFIAIQGTARTSMWKSSFNWIKDYWLIGSGLDTIKYMYPKYRRDDYGVLEGGHNYTPDRLHNEYLNTLSTKGFLGFLAYYGLVIIGWLYLVIKGSYEHRSSPLRFIAVSAMCGALVYLGQVFFNFGVVATLFLFFALAGLSLSIFQGEVFDY